MRIFLRCLPRATGQDREAYPIARRRVVEDDEGTIIRAPAAVAKTARQGHRATISPLRTNASFSRRKRETCSRHRRERNRAASTSPGIHEDPLLLSTAVLLLLVVVLVASPCTIAPARSISSSSTTDARRNHDRRSCSWSVRRPNRKPQGRSRGDDTREMYTTNSSGRDMYNPRYRGEITTEREPFEGVAGIQEGS